MLIGQIKESSCDIEYEEISGLKRVAFTFVGTVVAEGDEDIETLEFMGVPVTINVDTSAKGASPSDGIATPMRATVANGKFMVQGTIAYIGPGTYIAKCGGHLLSLEC